MVLVWFEVVFHCFEWFGLFLRNFCIKEMMKFQRICCQKIFKTHVFVLAISKI